MALVMPQLMDNTASLAVAGPVDGTRSPLPMVRAPWTAHVCAHQLMSQFAAQLITNLHTQLLAL